MEATLEMEENRGESGGQKKKKYGLKNGFSSTDSEILDYLTREFIVIYKWLKKAILSL